MFCTRCGMRVEDGNRFCQACGQEVGAPASAEPNTASVAVSAATPYAGFWLRLVAHFIDGLILGIPVGLVVIILIFFLGGFGLMLHRNPVDPRAFAALLAPLLIVCFFLMLLLMALYWLYFAGMESSARQATFGKAVMSLQVTDLEGRRLSFKHATGRFFAKIVSGMIPLGIGYIMAGFTAKKQALHDMIAGTLVLRKT
jgi:uncharacterized RDD family membrane protein YckC